MISRRNFLIILLMMGVLLFMFQFSQLVKENGNDYETNEYYGTGLLSGEDAWQPAQKESAFASLEGYALLWELRKAVWQRLWKNGAAM